MAPRGKILVVDDEKEIADLVELYLVNEGYEVFTFYDAQAALVCIHQKELDLAILDVMLPEIDGFSLCTTIRKTHTFPIIMLTAKDDEVNRITGLTLGADDYVLKPFLPLELLARVKAQLRRYKTYQNPSNNKEDTIVLGDLSLNAQTHECILDGKTIHLTPTEFSILIILGKKKGQVISAEELSRQIWKDEYYEKGSTAITVHIRHIREKMGESFEKPRYIKTVWGVGYKLDNN